MTIAEEIADLRHQIHHATVRISELQSGCQHPNVRHREYPDIHSGWGIENTCPDCLFSFGCMTRRKYPDDEPKDEIITRGNWPLSVK